WRAARLGMPRTTLVSQMRKLGIPVDKFSRSRHNRTKQRRCLFGRRPNVCCLERQVRHATQVKKHAVPRADNAKEHVFALCAPCHDARILHVHVCMSKRLCCAAMRALPLSQADVRGEYSAQFACSSISIEVV